MRIRYSFSSRRTRQIDNKNKHRVAFPEITRKVIAEADIILEVLDARFIEDTRNSVSEKEIKKLDKTLIYVINKSDLVNIKKTKDKLALLGLYPYVFVSCKDRKGKTDLRQRIQIESKKVVKSYEDIDDRIKVGVIGYPNTGKSSIINFLVGKGSARVSAQSGFTKGIQKIKLFNNIMLIDTPGVIPGNEDSTINSADLIKHTKINVRTYDKVKDPEFLVLSLMQKYPGIFEKFYEIDADGDTEVLLEQLGRKKNLIKKGNKIDIDRAARIILKDWQEGRISPQ